MRTNKADLRAKYKLCKRRYIKSKRQDGNGVSPLKENGQLHSDSRRKAEILNNQFCSVFTSEDTTNIPS